MPSASWRIDLCKRIEKLYSTPSARVFVRDAHYRYIRTPFGEQPSETDQACAIVEQLHQMCSWVGQPGPLPKGGQLSDEERDLRELFEFVKCPGSPEEKARALAKGRVPIQLWRRGEIYNRCHAEWRNRDESEWIMQAVGLVERAHGVGSSHRCLGADSTKVTSPASRARPKDRKRSKADRVRELLSRDAPFEGTKSELAAKVGYSEPSALAHVKNFDNLWLENARKLAAARAAREKRMLPGGG